MSKKLHNLKILLESLYNDDLSTKELEESFKEFNALKELVILEKLGFIIRQRESNLTQSMWKITDTGRFFFKTVEDEEEDFNIVMTIPPKFSKEVSETFPYIKSTKKIFTKLIKDSTSDIRIFMPYVDASFVSLLEGVDPKVSLKIITSFTKYGSGRNAILERLKSKRNMSIKYLGGSDGDLQLFQLHAKIFISDNKRMYIGSANLKETSIFYNLESGLLTYDLDIIDKYILIFDYFYRLAK